MLFPVFPEQCSNSTFVHNTAHAGVMHTNNCSVNTVNCSFHRNFRAIYALSSTLTFNGYTILSENSDHISQKNKFTERDEGGAITIVQSVVIFNGVSHLINNKARDGGAILAIGSKMYFNGKITFAYNEATSRHFYGPK